jgi:hypothetical protein
MFVPAADSNVVSARVTILSSSSGGPVYYCYVMCGLFTLCMNLCMDLSAWVFKSWLACTALLPGCM